MFCVARRARRAVCWQVNFKLELVRKDKDTFFTHAQGQSTYSVYVAFDFEDGTRVNKDYKNEHLVNLPKEELRFFKPQTLLEKNYLFTEKPNIRLDRLFFRATEYDRGSSSKDAKDDYYHGQFFFSAEPSDPTLGRAVKPDNVTTRIDQMDRFQPVEAARLFFYGSTAAGAEHRGTALRGTVKLFARAIRIGTEASTSKVVVPKQDKLGGQFKEERVYWVDDEAQAVGEKTVQDIMGTFAAQKLQRGFGAG